MTPGLYLPGVQKGILKFINMAIFSVTTMAENGDHEQDYSYTEEVDQETYPEELAAGEGDATGDSVVADTSTDGLAADDPELEAIKARVREMEEEAEKLKEMQSEVEKQMNLSSSSTGLGV